MSPKIVILLSIVILLLLNCSNDSLHQGQCPILGSPNVLVDLYHTRKQNHEDYRLEKDNYNYQGAYGYYRAFQHLQENGYHIASLRSKPLNEICLSSYDVLFINLLHTERPKISTIEEEKIKEYVSQGGSLFIIADHTNVYRHAERLNPLLSSMGIKILYSIIADFSPSYTIEGNGWIKINHFRKHPITEGLRTISFQTGTAFESEYGVIFSSEKSFADYWNESDSHGFYGDWKFNGDLKKEPKGSLPVVVAREYKKGRVVVVGDQNIFGDSWLYMADNFQLFMNIFVWLAHQENKKPILREVRPHGLNIGIDLKHSQYNLGKTSGEGYFSFFAHLNRDPSITARGMTRLNTDNDIIIFLDPSLIFSTKEIELIKNYIKKGKRIVIICEIGSLSLSTIKLLRAIVPDFSVELNGKSYVIQDGEEVLIKMKPSFIKNQFFSLQSNLLSVSGLEIASMNVVWHGNEYQNYPYLLDLRSTWGSPFLWTTYKKQQIDIARIKKIGQSEVIIFLQDRFLQGRTLGAQATSKPDKNGENVALLIYSLLDYLKTSIK